MTREPFIAHSKLTNEIYIVSGREKYRVTEQAIKAVDAIKALEQQPCEDVISRQAAIDALRNAENYAFNSYHKGLIKAHKIIADLPSVTPQPKMGHWTRELIRNEKGGCIGAKMICSECGNDNKHDEYMTYCPNCGAKMITPQESEVNNG